jgi:Uma2 family endonuclease
MIARAPFRFTVERYDAMIDAGIFGENDAVELIRGEIVRKMPIGDKHSACLMRLNEYLVQQIGKRAMFGIQNPIVLPDSEPEPDVSVVKRKDNYYADGKPRAEDVLLIIEVADSSLEFDRVDKLPIYAEAAIPEYWIVNLIEDLVEIYRDPDGSTYATTNIVRRGDSIALLHLPDVTIAVSDILPS